MLGQNLKTLSIYLARQLLVAKKGIQLIVKEMFINLQIQMMEHGTGLGVQEIKQFH